MSASTCVPRLLAILCGCLLMACTGGNSIEPAGVKPAGEPSTAEVWHTAGHIGGPVRSVAVAGGYAYVAHSGELAVIDLADPHAPRRVGYVLLPANHVTVSGTYAYVAGRDGLRIVHVATPAAPRQVGFVAVPATVLDVAVAGGFAYLAGLRVLDVTDPANPAQVAVMAAPGAIRSLTATSDGVFVIDAGNQVWSLDVSQPTQFQRRGFCPAPASAEEIFVRGDQVFVAAGERGVVVLAKSQASLGSLGSAVLLDTFDYASSITATEDAVFVADRMGGLFILHASRMDERRAQFSGAE